MLNKVFLRKIKEKLLNEKKSIINQYVKKVDVDVDGDETDEIQGNMLIEMQNQLNIRNNLKLHQIDEAINRMSQNKYGLCQDCEEDIPEKRLLINPYFLTCVNCSEERELKIKRKSYIG